jgi:hypothetical protein
MITNLTPHGVHICIISLDLRISPDLRIPLDPRRNHIRAGTIKTLYSFRKFRSCTTGRLLILTQSITDLRHQHHVLICIPKLLVTKYI